MTLENMIERLECLLVIGSALSVTFHEEDVKLMYELLKELKASRAKLEIYQRALAYYECERYFYHLS